MLGDRPLVSVIVAVYNGGRYLASALESVFQQEYRPLEVIVVDDGSTDNTADVARSFEQVRYIYQANQGVASARNTGIAASRGEMIAFLDADDLWTPNKLTVQVGYLLERPEVLGAIGRQDNFVDPEMARAGQIPQQSPLEKELIAVISLVARRDAFERVGSFDPSYRVGSDMEWRVRAKDLGVVVDHLTDTVLRRRIHDSNLSQDMSARAAATLRMLKASVDRQRAGKAARGNGR